MKIAYIVFHPISKNDGVVKKVFSQITEFKSYGNEVQVFAFSKDGKKSNVLDALVYQEKKSNYRFRKNQHFLNDILKYNPDKIYCRYDTYNRSVFHLIKQGIPIIFEYNTYDLSESWLLFKKSLKIKELLKWSFYFLSRKFWIKQAAGHVFVTEDLLQKYKSIIPTNKPRIAIPNSISFCNFQNVNISNFQKKTPNIVFIGTPNQPWHGLDLIKELSRKLTDIHFDIIGYNGIDELNITYHGYLDADQFSPIISNSSACIGPLGIHEYNLNQSSPLKVREYILLGAPVILGYNDFPLARVKDEPLILHLSSNQNNWHIEISNFLNNLKTQKKIYNKTTLELIDSKFIEKQRVEFVASI